MNVAMVQVVKLGEVAAAVTMKAIVAEGFDLISGRKQINAMWLVSPCCLLGGVGLWGQDTLQKILSQSLSHKKRGENI